MAYQSVRSRIEDLNREKTQHRLTQAAAGTAILAGGMRMAPWAARRSARALTHWKPRTNLETNMKRRITWAGSDAGQKRMERAATTTGVTAGLVGGVSTLGFARQQKRQIGEKEKALNLVKAAGGSDDWRDYVSPRRPSRSGKGNALAAHEHLRRGQQRFTGQAAGYGVGAAGLGGLSLAASSRGSRPGAVLATASGAGAGYSAAKSVQRAKRARSWRDKKRAIERRGRARAAGIPDSVSASQLPDLVGKALLLRAPKPRVAVARKGGFFMRNGRTFYRRGA